MEQHDEQKDKALIAFGVEFLAKLDAHWKSKLYSNRSEYIRQLVRSDMEKEKTK